MFCDQCGARVDGPARFCPNCGKNFAGAAPVPPLVSNAYGRVVRHLRTLGILWLVWGGITICGSLFAMFFFSHTWWWFEDVPWFVPRLVRGFGMFGLFVGCVKALAGWGLMERRPWARTLAMVVGILALFSFPFGTALGIYTLWVLAPSTSDLEYRSIARPV